MDRPWIRQYEPGVPPSLAYPGITLPELLTRTVSRYPDHPAIRFYGRMIRYRELDALANGFARALLQLGLRRGETVALLLPNLPQSVIAYYGTLRAGGVVTPINPLFVESEIEC